MRRLYPAQPCSVSRPIFPPLKSRGLGAPKGDSETAAWYRDAPLKHVQGNDRAEANPGVTTHRVTRTEYSNTIRDLQGVDFRAEGVV